MKYVIKKRNEQKWYNRLMRTFVEDFESASVFDDKTVNCGIVMARIGLIDTDIEIKYHSNEAARVRMNARRRELQQLGYTRKEYWLTEDQHLRVAKFISKL